MQLPAITLSCLHSQGFLPAAQQCSRDIHSGYNGFTCYLDPTVYLFSSLKTLLLMHMFKQSFVLYLKVRSERNAPIILRN